MAHSDMPFNFQHLSILKNKESGEFFKILLFRKNGWTIAHEKCHFLFDMAFLVKEITNLTSNLT
jgi:hypothetical protein